MCKFRKKGENVYVVLITDTVCISEMVRLNLVILVVFRLEPISSNDQATKNCLLTLKVVKSDTKVIIKLF